MSEAQVANRTESSRTIVNPPKWRVVLFNDDTTPMDYVIELLMRMFHHSMEDAKEIMLTVHNAGRGIAGVYPYEIAEQKTSEAAADARTNGYHLQLDIEQD